MNGGLVHEAIQLVLAMLGREMVGTTLTGSGYTTFRSELVDEEAPCAISELCCKMEIMLPIP